MNWRPDHTKTATGYRWLDWLTAPYWMIRDRLTVRSFYKMLGQGNVQEGKTVARRLGDQTAERALMFTKWRTNCLDLWLALGGDSLLFDDWYDGERMSPADAWSLLLSAVRGDVVVLLAATNPPAGQLLAVVGIGAEDE